MPFPALFAPLDVGPVRARNRIVCGAHFTQFTEPDRTWGEPGLYGARYARYLGEMARGGAGIVIAGQAQVHPSSAYQMPNNAAAWPEAAIPGLRLLAESVGGEGALAFLQLAHNGGVTHGAWSKQPALAASAVASYLEPPKPIEPHEIAEVIEGFARSAANCAAAGLHGIEVHAAHGYLLHEFLSPRTNRRDDAYGGSFESRLRLPCEVLAAVRDAAGPRLAVGVRLVGDEECGQAGLGPKDAAAIAAALEARGLVDFVNVSVGISGIGMVRPVYVPHAFATAAARTVKQALGRTPVFTVHRIVEPAEAEAIVAAGDADAVTLVRALIADPDWPAKARAGRAHEIRRCTGCNQGCYGNLLQSLPVTCATNPAVGREAELGSGTLRPAARAKRVVVVGAGPAGLEAAWVAAARGHRVVIVEREAVPGGKVRLAATLPGRRELADFADWRVDECARRGVELRLGAYGDAASVLALSPDAVVVATGGRATTDAPSKWHPFPIPGADAAPPGFVIDHETALRGWERLGRRLLVLDAVGHIEAIGLAELLASEGREVTLATPLPSPIALDAETAAHALPRAARAGARWRPGMVLAAVGPRSATLVDVLSQRAETLAELDAIVIRTHGVAENGLAAALAGRVPEIVCVGDAVAVRSVDRAIFDGHRAGRAL